MNAPTHSSKKNRILVVDDSSTIRNLIKEVLNFSQSLNFSGEYDISFAGNGVEALEVIESAEPFDIILIDIDMPRMNGSDCIREIRRLSDPKKANVPVIACTGDAKSTGEEGFKAMGFDALFTKPFVYKDLIEKIKRTLATRR